MIRIAAQSLSIAFLTASAFQSPKLGDLEWIPQYVFPLVGVAVLVGTYMQQVREQNKNIEEQKNKIESLDKEDRQTDKRIDAHIQWDMQAHAKINREFDRVVGRLEGVLKEFDLGDSGRRVHPIGRLIMEDHDLVADEGDDDATQA